jgi:hypothetical protein
MDANGDECDSGLEPTPPAALRARDGVRAATSLPSCFRVSS